MYKAAILYGVWLFPIVLFLSCGTVRNYPELDKPFFQSNDISQFEQTDDSLHAVTFNIKKADEIDLAIAELKALEEIRKNDVYLLQEMNEKGVEAIAKELKLNYLYIPIVYNKLDHQNVGNAILTRGSIQHPEKFILPHAKWVNKRYRLATVAEVNIDHQKILVYSVHTETVMMSRKKRMDQVHAILEHATQHFPDYQYILIGGDFNTLYAKDNHLVVTKFRDCGFDWSTATVGSTAEAFMGMLNPTHDYLFSRGLKQVNAGKFDASKSSDHLPVYATFTYK